MVGFSFIGIEEFHLKHNLRKPVDKRFMELICESACLAGRKIDDMVFLYVNHQELYFIYGKKSNPCDRISETLVSRLTSGFCCEFALKWNKYFPDVCMTEPLDVVANLGIFPRKALLIDHLKQKQQEYYLQVMNKYIIKILWDNEQPDLGIVSGSLAEKNDFLFHYGVNYSQIDPIFRKGIIYSSRNNECIYTDINEPFLKHIKI